MKIFDPTKPARTREGKTARIICTDVDSTSWKIIALVRMDDVETAISYTKYGEFYSSGTESRHDLFNIEPETEIEKYDEPAIMAAFEKTISEVFSIPSVKQFITDAFVDNLRGGRPSCNTD